MDRADKGKREGTAPFLRAVRGAASNPGDAAPRPESDARKSADTGPGDTAARPAGADDAGRAPEGGDPAADSRSDTARLDPNTPRLGYSARKTRPKPLTRTAPPTPATAPAAPPADHVKPIAGPAKLEKRHRGILLSFVALVLLPVALTAFYLWEIARDQYASTVAFSIRKEELSSSLDLLGGITQLSGSGGSDTDILYDFIRSQELVAEIDADLDLSAIYSLAWPHDPIFAYDPDGTIEDLLRHWKQKVQITYDTGTGLMTLRILAFDPDDATQIANAILRESTRKINELSVEARADATRYAEAEVERAVERLKEARGAMTAFRLQSQVIDPTADLQGQTGVLNNLQSQLADTLVELDLLRFSATESDPRIQQLERRIEVIEKRIQSEREKFGIDGQGPGGEDYATLMAEFERLAVDREFAEETYRAALVSYDAALAEAKRKSRYLAAHITPTEAERSDYPRRWTLLGLTSFFLLMAWSMGVLIYYSVRDRR